LEQDRLISVRPVSGGWCVRCVDTGELMFLSGARAEEKAQSLALLLSALGSDVQLSVHDLRDQLVATRRYFGDSAPPPAPKPPAARTLELVA
jgi:hypothetical protein